MRNLLRIWKTRERISKWKRPRNRLWLLFGWKNFRRNSFASKNSLRKRSTSRIEKPRTTASSSVSPLTLAFSHRLRCLLLRPAVKTPPSLVLWGKVSHLRIKWCKVTTKKCSTDLTGKKITILRCIWGAWNWKTPKLKKRGTKRWSGHSQPCSSKANLWMRHMTRLRLSICRNQKGPCWV